MVQTRTARALHLLGPAQSALAAAEGTGTPGHRRLAVGRQAMACIERENPQLKGVPPKYYFHPALDKASRDRMIDLISNIHVGDETNGTKDKLTREDDACCGSSGMFEQSVEFMREHANDIDERSECDKLTAAVRPRA